MQWESWTDFWAMGGSGLFVWGSYGLFLVLVVLEVVFVRTRYKAALQRLLRKRKNHES